MLASLSVMFASTDKAVSISDNSVLVLDVGTQIPDRGIDDPFSSFDFIDMTFKPSVGLNDIIMNLKKAGDDENIIHPHQIFTNYINDSSKKNRNKYAYSNRSDLKKRKQKENIN